MTLYTAQWDDQIEKRKERRHNLLKDTYAAVMRRMMESTHAGDAG